MAHQNLKFRLHLNDSVEWQPIYAGQDFNTFYVVYVKFMNLIEDSDSLMGNLTASYRCKFRIQNFRGAVSIGFSKEPKLYKVKDKEFTINIEIFLKAFHFNEYSKEIDFPFVEKIDRSKLLKTKVSLDLPAGMYNKKKPIESDYLLPYKYERDGDTAIELGRRTAGSTKPFKNYSDEGISGGEFGICSPDTSLLF